MIRTEFRIHWKRHGSYVRFSIQAKPFEAKSFAFCAGEIKMGLCEFLDFCQLLPGKVRVVDLDNGEGDIKYG